MLRFPNPGSSVNNLVRVYQILYSTFNDQVFTLDEITSAIVSANMATSSGYIGSEAIKRSTRSNRSKDPLYNQSKMYAELFRWLGWLHPMESKALNYRCTLLGAQINEAGDSYIKLLEECVLGMVCPNPNITIKGNHELRPIAFILKIMALCDGYLSRDEMIIGPLSAASDRDDRDLQQVASIIQKARESKNAIDKALDEVASQRQIAVNTLKNYTRFPIALLRDLGWTYKQPKKLNDGSKRYVFMLSDRGKLLARRLYSSVDLRPSDINEFDDPTIKALALFTHYQMLKRSNFNISRHLNEMTSYKSELQSKFNTSAEILFSPFQSIQAEKLATIFGFSVECTLNEASSEYNQTTHSCGRDNRSHLFVIAEFVDLTGQVVCQQPLRLEVEVELRKLAEQHHNLTQAAKAFVLSHESDTQKDFYPLVTDLFKIIGFEGDHSRAGVNYQRWDAYVLVNDSFLPIEIKSPTEEFVLSTKAVRQALENKIILLSRGGLEVSRNSSTLIVGNKYPNERGEMSNLIDDIYKAYNIKIGVIDLFTLAFLAVNALVNCTSISPNQLFELKGFLDVENNKA